MDHDRRLSITALAAGIWLGKDKVEFVATMPKQRLMTALVANLHDHVVARALAEALVDRNLAGTVQQEVYRHIARTATNRMRTVEPERDLDSGASLWPLRSVTRARGDRARSRDRGHSR